MSSSYSDLIYRFSNPPVFFMLTIPHMSLINLSSIDYISSSIFALLVSLYNFTAQRKWANKSTKGKNFEFKSIAYKKNGRKNSNTCHYQFPWPQIFHWDAKAVRFWTSGYQRLRKSQDLWGRVFTPITHLLHWWCWRGKEDWWRRGVSVGFRRIRPTFGCLHTQAWTWPNATCWCHSITNCSFTPSCLASGFFSLRSNATCFFWTRSIVSSVFSNYLRGQRGV